ncbi:MAG: flagellar motor switch protein FliG [Rhodobiaceae bacterium]|nr:flagellar motor switch protein FliG [Rhodobiaceae bacterium]MCC0015374.1 flagellar motor switch protein FliG [Rhodobiaceae bacterium]MCC0041985.1 flagellar motor switch protein FliG [Rhodobiaceae bacterium]MCC0053387.1 flagellar motor switch protein FliG [Rhodobiaceae bacterium]
MNTLPAMAPPSEMRDLAADTPLESISGPERAAIILLALGEQHGRAVWAALDDDEVRRISIAMSKLGKVASEVVEKLLGKYVLELGKAGALVGNFDNTERLLVQFLPEDRVHAIMEEIRGPAGRTMWEKLSNVQEEVLANYLKNEYPQTIAVVLSKIRAEHASRVLAVFPEELALDVVHRMLRMESIQKDILDKIEQTLRVEFMANLSQTRRRDAHELMADIFNNFDRQTETRFLTALEEQNREAADRIKQLMFTFEDLSRLDAAGMQTLLRSIDKDKLAIALKGASEKMRDFFMQNMSQRAAKMLKEEMEVLGPVRLRDVDEAQSGMVNTAKDLAARGEIQISKKGGDDELVY